MNKKQLLARLRGMHKLLHQAQQLVDVAMNDLVNGLSCEVHAATDKGNVIEDIMEEHGAMDMPIQQPDFDLSTAFTRKRR